MELVSIDIVRNRPCGFRYFLLCAYTGITDQSDPQMEAQSDGMAHHGDLHSVTPIV